MKTLFFFLAACSTVCAFGQTDTIKHPTDRFQVKWFASSKQIGPFGYNRPVFVPKSIKIQRQTLNYGLTDHTSVSDEPYRHAAWCAGVSGQVEILPGYDFGMTLIGEHRGFSYGIYNTKNMRLIPQMLASVKDSLLWGRQVFNIYGRFGHLIQVRHDEGLMMYNADAQGFDIGVRWRRLEYNYTHYGDMAASIGLNMDEYAAHRLIAHLSERFQVAIGQIWAPDINTSTFSNKDFYSTLSGRFQWPESGHVYIQVGFRNGRVNVPSYQVTDNAAFVLGVSREETNVKFHLKTKMEARYYGKGFNADRYDPSVAYRNRQASSTDNFAGVQFIPLYRYQYEFSQWAVFSEYSGKNIWALVLNVEADVQIARKLWLGLMLDANPIFAENEPAFCWAFYTIGPKWKIRKDLEGQFGITNKILNLDVHYPTFYAARKPEWVVGFCKKI